MKHASSTFESLPYYQQSAPIISLLQGHNPRVPENHRRMLVASHVNPDGDAIGSTLAFAHIATACGFEVRLLLISGTPKNFRWLPQPWPVATTIEDLGSWVPHVLVTLDCGDARRPGPALEAFFLKQTPPAPGWEQTFSINIDHHTGNPEFADLNWVEPGWAATGEMVGILAEHLGIPLTGDLGVAVYLSLVSDTGGFSFTNTKASTLALAARIVEQGLDINAFTSATENNWTIERMHAWGSLMQQITLHADGKIACVIVPKALMKAGGLLKVDLDGFAAMLRRIQGVQVGIYIREDEPEMCKLSLRSMGTINVNAIATHFGGGGHVAAAGAELAMTPEAAKAAVLERLFTVIK